MLLDMLCCQKGIWQANRVAFTALQQLAGRTTIQQRAVEYSCCGNQDSMHDIVVVGGVGASGTHVNHVRSLVLFCIWTGIMSSQAVRAGSASGLWLGPLW